MEGADNMIQFTFYDIESTVKVVRCIRTDASYAVYRFEDLSFDGTFPLDDDKPIEVGYKMLYQDEYDGEWRLFHVSLVEKDYDEGVVYITADHEFMHDCQSHLYPNGTDDNGFTFDYSNTDTDLVTLVQRYLPVTWEIGTVSPQITESGGTITTYKVSTAGARLNLRRGPGFNYSIIKAYANGTVVTFIDSDDPGWTHVEAPDGKFGWMYAANLALVSSSVAATEDYTVNKAITAGMSAQKLLNNIANDYQVIFTPRLEVNWPSITQYVDISVGEPVFSGARLSMNVSLSALSGIGDDSDVVTLIIPITSDGAIKLSVGTGELVAQTKSTDQIHHTGYYLTNSTRTTEIGEYRVRLVQFDPNKITSVMELQDAAIDYLIYYRDPWITIEATASDLYLIGYNGEPIGYHDLVVVALENGSYVTAMCSGLSRDYLNPEKTLVTLGTYRKDFALATAIVK